MNTCRTLALVAAASLAAAVPFALAQSDASPPPQQAGYAEAGLSSEASSLASEFGAHAEGLLPLMRTDVADAFLAQLPALPGVAEGRSIWFDPETSTPFSTAEREALDQASPVRERLVRYDVDDKRYYTEYFGTPALYAPALDLAARHGLATLAGKRVLDFGFGQIGHLRTMAAQGAHVTGIEVNPMIRAIYSEPGDTGLIAPARPGDQPGSLRLVFGRWPNGAGMTEAVSSGYDLILSKNVLKRGYIHPEREADPSQLIDLGATDAEFLIALRDALVPGGHVVIYNYSPPQAADDEPYLPWADGRCPFDQADIRAAGLEVLAYDEDDTEQAVLHFEAVGVAPIEDLRGNLFGSYTVLRRPAG